MNPRGGLLASWRRIPARRHAALIAVAYFTIGLGLYVGDLYAVTQDSRSAPLWLRILLLLGSTTLILMRKRAPLLALGLATVPLALDAAAGPTLPIWIVLSDLIYAATLYSSRRAGLATIITANLGSAAVVIAVMLTADDWRSGILNAGVLVVFVLTPVWWAVTVRVQRDVADTERARAAAVQTVAERDRQAVVAEERARLARDLHDVVAGHLSAIAIQSEAALNNLERDPSASAQVLSSVRSNSLDALQEMRSMIELLRSAETDSAATTPGLRGLERLVESARQSGSAVDVHADDLEPPPPSPVDLTAYRIIQESITNAVKHAPGETVRLAITRDPDALRIDVVNPVHGNGSTGEGFGIASMRERALALGGTLQAGSTDGQWRVAVALPLGSGS